MLLEPPQPFPDLAGSDGADALDGLEVALGGPDNRVERAKVGDDPAHDELRHPRGV